MTDTNRILLEQLRAIGTRGMRLVVWNDTTIKVSIGNIGAMIAYNYGRDLYDIAFYDGFNITETFDGLYAENLDVVLLRVRDMARRPAAAMVGA